MKTIFYGSLLTFSMTLSACGTQDYASSSTPNADAGFPPSSPGAPGSGAGKGLGDTNAAGGTGTHTGNLPGGSSGLADLELQGLWGYLKSNVLLADIKIFGGGLAVVGAIWGVVKKYKKGGEESERRIRVLPTGRPQVATAPAAVPRGAPAAMAPAPATPATAPTPLITTTPPLPTPLSSAVMATATTTPPTATTVTTPDHAPVPTTPAAATTPAATATTPAPVATTTMPAPAAVTNPILPATHEEVTGPVYYQPGFEIREEREWHRPGVMELGKAGVRGAFFGGLCGVALAALHLWAIHHVANIDNTIDVRSK